MQDRNKYFDLGSPYKREMRPLKKGGGVRILDCVRVTCDSVGVLLAFFHHGVVVIWDNESCSRVTMGCFFCQYGLSI